MKRKSLLPLAALIAKYIQLTKIGSQKFVGRCPFCRKSGAFNVDSVNGLWHCDSCKRRGDALTFIQIRHGMDEFAALNKLRRLGAGRRLK